MCRWVECVVKRNVYIVLRSEFKFSITTNHLSPFTPFRSLVVVNFLCVVYPYLCDSLAYKTQTHLTGIITRHNHMHHAFRCTCLLFLFFFLSLSPSPSSLSRFIQMRKSLACNWISETSLRNKWRRTCLNLPGNNMISTSNTQISKLSMEIWAQKYSFVGLLFRSLVCTTENCYSLYATGEPLHFTNCW